MGSAEAIPVLSPPGDRSHGNIPTYALPGYYRRLLLFQSISKARYISADSSTVRFSTKYNCYHFRNSHTSIPHHSDFHDNTHCHCSIHPVHIPADKDGALYYPIRRAREHTPLPYLPHTLYKIRFRQTSTAGSLFQHKEAAMYPIHSFYLSTDSKAFRSDFPARPNLRLNHRHTCVFPHTTHNFPAADLL